MNTSERYTNTKIIPPEITEYIHIPTDWHTHTQTGRQEAKDKHTHTQLQTGLGRPGVVQAGPSVSGGEPYLGQRHQADRQTGSKQAGRQTGTKQADRQTGTKQADRQTVTKQADIPAAGQT